MSKVVNTAILAPGMLVLLIFSIGCSKASSNSSQQFRHVQTGPPPPKVTPPDPQDSELEPESVTFDIQELGHRAVSKGDETTWQATFQSASGSAQFEIALVLPPPDPNSLFGFSTGGFIANPSSDYSDFVRAVAKALQAGQPKSGKPSKVGSNRLDFNVAILGRNVKHETSGAAGSSQTGADWLVTKVFVANGQGEFYLNLNAKAAIGEISIKDEDYGDIVLGEFAKVFHAKPSLGQ
jgi:hypothetical protein